MPWFRWYRRFWQILTSEFPLNRVQAVIVIIRVRKCFYMLLRKLLKVNPEILLHEITDQPTKQNHFGVAEPTYKFLVKDGVLKAIVDMDVSHGQLQLLFCL